MENLIDKLKSIMDNTQNSRGTRMAASRDWVKMIFLYAMWKHCRRAWTFRDMVKIGKRYEMADIGR